MNLHVDIFEKAQTMDVNFTESSQPFGSSMGEVQVLNVGKNGATFTPAVSAEGVVSWTNDRDLPNPAPVNIKGPKGDTGPAGKDGAKGEKGDKGDTGPQGEKGDTGAPGADGAKGDKGDKGDTGATGAQGEPGKDGADGKDGTSATHSWNGTVLTITSASGTSSADLKGEKGKDGNPGKDGSPGSAGKDGTSVTHSWSGTTLSVTSASGTSSANLKGEKGDKGDKGDTGPQGEKGDTGAAGTSVTVKSVSESTADGGSNVVTFSDGKTVTIKNGSRGSMGATGSDGKDGEDGYTPVAGVDYYTDADKAEFSAYIASELAKRGQLAPEYANSIEECTDTSKLYVLPDGFIYAYMLTEVESGTAYTNVLPLAIDTDGSIYNGTGYKNGYRLNSGATVKEASGQGHTGFIKVTNGDTVRMKNYARGTEGYDYIHYFNASFTRVNSVQPTDHFAPDANGMYTIVINSDCVYIRISAGEFTKNTIVTINEEITEGGGTVTEYAWANTGYAFVPADYEDRIIDLENKVGTLEDKIANDVATKSDLLYISPDGNDRNDGLTASTPKKTVKACVNAGATRISAKRGVYNEVVQLSNIGELEIFPTDNNLTYAVGTERKSIVFDTSDSVSVSSLAAYNSIKRVAYSNSANTQFDKVFTLKSQPPLYGGEYGSRYNATIWLLSEDEKTVCIKLKPVLTVAECEGEVNTFTYVDGYIYINADMTSVTKVIIPTNWDCGIYVNGAERFVLKEVEVRFAGSYNIDIRNCAYFNFYKCACKYTSYGSGFHPFNSNGKMTACYATKNYDGYGISGYGHTTYVDCVSEFNFDDGMSHHNGTTGTVIGGRYEGNGKGGNTPAYGAKVNIYGGLYKDNASFGIGYLWATDLEPASGMVQGAVMVDNPIGLSVQKNCDVTAMNCTYQGNTSDKDVKGNLTEY